MGNLRKSTQSIGIEDEFFVLENSASSRGKAQRLLLGAFAEKHNFRITAKDDIDGLPTQINKDGPSGYFCIKFDSTVNIFEVAHPPYSSLDDVIFSVGKVREDLTQLAASFGLTILYTGYRSCVLNKDSFIQKETVQKTIERPHSNKFHFDRFYHGKICSNQIHLALDAQKTFDKLQQFYKLEPLIPIFFSNSSVSGVAHCLRSLLIQDGFLDTYELFGFPLQIPNSDSEYSALKSKAEGLYRDYSLIVPRSFGTWEFRSACSQPNLSSLERLLKVRLGIVAIVEQSRIPLPFSIPEVRQVFIDACLNPNIKSVQQYLHTLEKEGFFEALEAATNVKLRFNKERLMEGA